MTQTRFVRKGTTEGSEMATTLVVTTTSFYFIFPHFLTFGSSAEGFELPKLESWLIVLPLLARLNRLVVDFMKILHV